VSTPEIRRLAARVGAISRRWPDNPDLPRLRHLLAVERADIALTALDQRRLTERERWRLRSRLNGVPPETQPVISRPVTPPGSHGHMRSPART
jgi:hypothetical protein